MLLKKSEALKDTENTVYYRQRKCLETILDYFDREIQRKIKQGLYKLTVRVCDLQKFVNNDEDFNAQLINAKNYLGTGAGGLGYKVTTSADNLEIEISWEQSNS